MVDFKKFVKTGQDGFGAVEGYYVTVEWESGNLHVSQLAEKTNQIVSEVDKLKLENERLKAEVERWRQRYASLQYPRDMEDRS